MEINVNVNLKLSGDPKLMTTLATLVESIQGVLLVSNAQLAVTPVKATEAQLTVVQTPSAVVQAPTPVVQQPTAAAQVAPAVVQTPVPAVPATAVPVTPVVPTAPAKNYTWAEIQTACAPLLDSGASQQALIALLPKYNVPSLTAIPPERYGELVQDLRALGAKL